jgi:hypothetical protein
MLLIWTHLGTALVAAGILPAVEPGFQPGGSCPIVERKLETECSLPSPKPFFRAAGCRPLRQAGCLTLHSQAVPCCFLPNRNPDIGLLTRCGRLMRFLSFRPAFYLRLPSDPISRWTPLPSGKAFPWRGLYWTSTNQATHPAGRNNKKPRGIAAGLMISLNLITSETGEQKPRDRSS